MSLYKRKITVNNPKKNWGPMLEEGGEGKWLTSSGFELKKCANFCDGYLIGLLLAMLRVFLVWNLVKLKGEYGGLWGRNILCIGVTLH